MVISSRKSIIGRPLSHLTGHGSTALHVYNQDLLLELPNTRLPAHSQGLLHVCGALFITGQKKGTGPIELLDNAWIRDLVKCIDLVTWCFRGISDLSFSD